MMRGRSVLVLVLALGAGPPWEPIHAAAPGAKGKPEVDFDRDVRPILEGVCVNCHGPDKAKGRLRLDTRKGLLAGGESGPAVVPGESGKSDLIRRVARKDPDEAMPPDDADALTAAQVAHLAAWIDAGAPYPAGGPLVPRKRTAAAAARRAALPPPAGHKVDFVKDIQPIFQSTCFGCHGPKKQESGLRLDHKPTVLRGGDRGPAFVSGKSAESLLVHFVAGLREEGRMPPKGPPLDPTQIGLLRAWIDSGAEFPDAASVVIEDRRNHWAFKAPVRPHLPQVRDPAWARNPVDHFVLARLDREGLRPAPEADRITLLRRLHLDLIGLPPTLAEVAAFLADTSPRAYEKQVDRLLASPHYGERWARHWLDAARYADSDGFEKDKSRQVWFFRDWVIGAINRDMPYDRFILEQVAGDLLPGATQDQVVATGFLRNSLLNEEGGVDPEQFRMDGLFDRMEAIGRSVLGLTVQCAQCHNHKYDPISQEEYYRLLAFLNNDHEPVQVVYTPDQQMKRSEILRRIADIEARLRRETPDWPARLARWEQATKMDQPAWTVLQAPFIDDSTSGQKFLPQKDGSYLAQGYAPTKGAPKTVVKTDLDQIGAFQLELFTHPNLPRGGPGRSLKGLGALSEIEIEAAPAAEPDKKKKVKLVKATADFEQAEAPLEAEFQDKPNDNPDDKPDDKRVVGKVAFAIDDKNNTAWGIDAGPGLRNTDRKAVFVPDAPIANPGGTILTITLVQKHGGWNSDDHMNNNLGRFRLSVTQSRDVTADPIPRRVREILAIAPAKRTAAQAAEIFAAFRTTVPAWKKANQEIADLWKKHPEGTTQLVVQTRDEGRATHMLKRGDFLRPGKQVTAGVVEALHPLPTDAPPTRLGLGRWLVDRRSPTTARVAVNRLWQTYFGTGLVATPEDLGTQGERPSHPDLLDWLAVELVDNRFSLKAMHRLIVTSATYRQSSKLSPESLERDPANRLLARGARFRVEAEIVRDIAFAASGLLNPEVGGRSLMQPAPAFLFQRPASYGPFPWIDETGSMKYRRALYTFRRRSTPYPMLSAFDTPSGETACARRVRSNTPLQALVTLNEPLALEAAQALGRRMVAEGGKTDAERVAHGFRRVLSRPPSAAEVADLLGLLERQRRRLAEGWADAWQIATGKSERPASLPAGVTPATLAAYTIIGRVLLNLDEAITRE